jgi:hypothetical protein
MARHGDSHAQEWTHAAINDSIDHRPVMCVQEIKGFGHGEASIERFYITLQFS